MKDNIGELNKESIIYSRDYRYLNRRLPVYILQVVLVLVPLVVGYLFTYSKISYYVSIFVSKILENIAGISTEIMEVDYFPRLGGVFYVAMEGKNPSFTMSIVSLFITLILIVIFTLIKTDKKPLMIFITIGLYIHLFSSAFFVFWGADRFPYDINDYSNLYMKQQIIVWLMIMIVYWMSTSLVTKVVGLRISTFIMVSAMSFLFGVTRYIVFMLILAKGSYLFMAVLYFTLGIFFDFIIMVGVYSIFMKCASRKFKKRNETELWKW